ncbi:hypothetical protein ACFLWR_04240 [Chloroflexota bacterium]
MFVVGDRVTYKDGEEPIPGVVEVILRKPDGELAGYKVRLDDGRVLMCAEDDDEVVGETEK